MDAELVICLRMQQFIEAMGLFIEHIKTRLGVDVIGQRLVPKLFYILDLTY